jgi:hypothetical protein
MELSFTNMKHVVMKKEGDIQCHYNHIHCNNKIDS